MVPRLLHDVEVGHGAVAGAERSATPVSRAGTTRWSSPGHPPSQHPTDHEPHNEGGSVVKPRTEDQKVDIPATVTAVEVAHQMRTHEPLKEGDLLASLEGEDGSLLVPARRPGLIC